MRKKTYLVSQDLWMLFAIWAKKFGFNIPGKAYFAKLSQGIARDLQAAFNRENQSVRVQIISFDRMRRELRKNFCLVPGEMVVSLDKVYFPGDFQLEINRVVCRKDGEWKDLGECNRPGFESINQQLDRIGLKVNGNNIIVVDDGCWSGGSISRVVKELRDRNVHIGKVLVGVYIDSGKLSLDVPLKSAIRFSADSVTDWICERDFILGAPLGGRTVVVDSCDEMGNSSYGAYYLYGMGDYANWASLQFEEGSVKLFTRQCVERAISLFETIEHFSKKFVMVGDLSRLPYGIEFNCHERFIDVLKRQI